MVVFVAELVACRKPFEEDERPPNLTQQGYTHCNVSTPLTERVCCDDAILSISEARALPTVALAAPVETLVV